ncbi:hypothetical protein PI95_031780 [Hassallia byssoidea VB512170]|uniref:Uncharacterized protein n=1 Tax=Hassallia byssoidea VB512170 TaxID=1304833 RepID=A0A846HHU8_9CYAN|nr:hypothetical protein [Hassalia byssoidea]NEU76955.1 hypothetical protein [Hassalia byssoidea VB512170]
MPIFNPSESVISTFVVIKAENVNIGQASVNSTVEEVIQENHDRRGLTITNTHSSNVYFDVYEGILDATNYMFMLKPNGIYEMPTAGAIYTGAFYARAVSGNGEIIYREFTS